MADSIYTLEDLKWDTPTKNQQDLPISRRVHFGFTLQTS